MDGSSPTDRLFWLIFASVVLTACSGSDQSRAPALDARGADSGHLDARSADGNVSDSGAVDAVMHDGGCTNEQHVCGGQCVARTSTSQCGSGCQACPDVVGGVARCRNDACDVLCNTSTPSRCGNRCVDFTSDPMNCGGCDRACAVGQLCSQSRCADAPQCSPGSGTCTGLTYCASTGRCTPGCDGSSAAQCPSDRMCNPTSHACVCRSDRQACGNACATCPALSAQVESVGCVGETCVVTRCATGFMPSASASDCVPVDASALRWERRTPTTSPSARYFHTMTFDSTRNQVVLFGGGNGTAVFGDTWIWDGSNWVDVTPRESPTARSKPTMVYDSARDEVVLFGGARPDSSLSDTWTWNGATWSQENPSAVPSARQEQAMVYDGTRGRVLLFGGTERFNFLGDSWTWDGTTWSRLLTNDGPPRRWHSMAFDAARNRVVVFGGFYGVTRGDTWTLDDRQWVQAPRAASPSARYWTSMVYDSRHQRVLLFGGLDNERYNDLWAWDGTTWTQIATSNAPDARSAHAMAFDSVRNRVVLFGGYNARLETVGDTWELILPE